MPIALAQMYETLTEQQQQQVYNYVFSFYEKNEIANKEIGDDFFGALHKYANPTLIKN